jgi:hypothetical protein
MEEIFAVLGLFATPALIGVTVAWLYTRGELRRLRQERQATLRPDDRIDRMEQAMDAIAVEVERLAQSQQFTARLLAEREQREADVGTMRGPGSGR